MWPVITVIANPHTKLYTLCIVPSVDLMFVEIGLARWALVGRFYVAITVLST